MWVSSLLLSLLSLAVLACGYSRAVLLLSLEVLLVKERAADFLDLARDVFRLDGDLDLNILLSRFEAAANFLSLTSGAAGC